MMQNRIDIERAILGAIIFCDGYAQVAHILSPKNFTSTAEIHNREVYEVIAGLFPDRPIDMVSVLQELSVRYPKESDIGHWVFSCDNYVSASSNITYWALILLQIDVTDKYRDQLIFWRDRRARDFDHTEKGVLDEMIESIRPGVDIFEFIEKSIEYFGTQNMQKEHDGAVNFSKDFLEKAQRIRRVGSINTILKHLFLITKCTPELQFQCEAFAKAIADMVSTGMTNDRYTKAIGVLFN